VIERWQCIIRKLRPLDIDTFISDIENSSKFGIARGSLSAFLNDTNISINQSIDVIVPVHHTIDTVWSNGPRYLDKIRITRKEFSIW